MISDDHAPDDDRPDVIDDHRDHERDGRARTSRDNGRKGGRPRQDRHFEDFEVIPEPPTHPVELGHWMQWIIALDVHRVQLGRDNEELSQEIRGYTVAMSKLLRPIILLAGADLEGTWWRDPPEEPPAADDPVAMSYWLLRALALGLHACVHGHTHAGAKMRAMVSAFVKSIPPDTLYDARDKVMEWTKRAHARPGPTPKPTEPPGHDHEERHQPIHC